MRDFGPALGVLPFVIWIVIMIGATSNAVNLTDGLDGLATGATILCSAAYVLIANWQLRNDCTVELANNCYPVRDPLDIAVSRRPCSAGASASFGGTPPGQDLHGRHRFARARRRAGRPRRVHSDSVLSSSWAGCS